MSGNIDSDSEDYVESRREMLRHGGFAMSKTFGSSMRPLIWGGAHSVAVVPLDGEPAIGDLLMFRETGAPRNEEAGGSNIVHPDPAPGRNGVPNGPAPGRNIVHRLVAIREEGGGRLYITRGDNCLASETVRRHEIIGRVAEVHRLGGWRPWYVLPGRRFAVTDRAYRLYSRLWQLLWPLRRPIYALRSRLYHLTH